MSVYNVRPEVLIKRVSEDLKNKVEAPDWAAFVKTSAGKDKPPSQENWWYIRMASILQKLYKKGPLGVSRLRSEYKTKKNRGSKPERSYTGGGKITRVALQQLAELGFVKITDDAKGRELTPAGRSYLDKIAKSI